MEGFSRINYSGVVFSRVDREDVRGPQQLKEHTLLYIRSGRAEVVCDDHRTPLAAGDCVFLRKDHRLILDAWTPDGEVPFQSVALFFCRKFLHSYYRTLHPEELPRNAHRGQEPVLKIPAGPEIESLFLSLAPYLDSTDTLPEEVAWLKRLEGARLVLAADRNVYASLFDFAQPWKVDLLGFMEENYLYDLSVPELARYTGRSLSAFKRDFKKVSELTPEKWVLRRRLQDAHRLLAAGNCRVADAMLESGFRDPAFFSRAYKKCYGYPPRETPVEGDSGSSPE